MDETGERAGDLILVGMFFFFWRKDCFLLFGFGFTGGRRWDGLRDDRGGNKVFELCCRMGRCGVTVQRV